MSIAQRFADISNPTKSMQELVVGPVWYQLAQSTHGYNIGPLACLLFIMQRQKLWWRPGYEAKLYEYRHECYSARQ